MLPATGKWMLAKALSVHPLATPMLAHNREYRGHCCPTKLKKKTSLTSLLGMELPLVGFGTFLLLGKKGQKAIKTAVRAGYRHFDTAFLYQNEREIGCTLNEMIKCGEICRDELFIATKVPAFGMTPEKCRKFFYASLKALDLGYIDLYLIHFPVGIKDDGTGTFILKKNTVLECDTDHVAVWRQMEKFVKEGSCRHIGVCNFNINQLTNLLKYADIPPTTNQVELHPYLQQRKLVWYCQNVGIIPVAYSPVGAPGLDKFVGRKSKSKPLLCDKALVKIAIKKCKSPAQVSLRFLIQSGVAVIPKSSISREIKDNIDIFDFELSKKEMKTIRKLDKGEKGRIFNHTIFKGMRDHPEYPFRSKKKK